MEDLGGGTGNVMLKVYFEGDENVPELIIVMIAQLSEEYIKSH